MNVNNLLIGGGGVTGIEMVQNVELPTSTETSEILKVLMQVIVTVAALLGLFKKKEVKTI